jgi:hypothetical protein
MSERFQHNAYDREPPAFPGEAQPPPIPRRHPPLPAWLAARLLRADEKVTWVCGPRFNPSWERYATHATLFLGALAVAVVCMAVGWLFVEMWAGLMLLAVLLAAGLVFGSIFVLGIANGYFTRLVATNYRLVILQGYAVCRTWAIDELPRSMIRYSGRGDGERSRTLDLDAMKTMLGGSSDQFADAKTILAFGKQLGQIKARENDRL